MQNFPLTYNRHTGTALKPSPPEDELKGTALSRRGYMARNNHWDQDDQKQYQHVHDSEVDRGQDERSAERIAAATVNKQRTREGRTLRQEQERRGQGQDAKAE